MQLLLTLFWYHTSIWVTLFGSGCHFSSAHSLSELLAKLKSLTESDNERAKPRMNTWRNLDQDQRIKDQSTRSKIEDRGSGSGSGSASRIKDQRSRIKDQRQGHLEKSWPFEVSSPPRRLFIHCAVADFPRFFISFKLFHCF